MKCSCGAEVTKAEIRVVERCARGHFVRSAIAPSQIATTTVAPSPATPGQRRAFHGKAGRLDEYARLTPGTTKKRVLAQLGRDSTEGLTETEMSNVLDQLERELEGAATAAR